MELKIYDKRLQDKSQQRLKFVATWFPKHECKMIAFVNYETLNKIKYNEYAMYFTIKPSYVLDEENLYAVGFSRKNAKISDFDVKYLIINK